MTMAKMEANLHLIIIAGSATVATILLGMINYLCQNPSVLKTLVDAGRSAAHQKTDLTLTTLSKLPYLMAVIKEGLRVVSPAPISFPRVVLAGGAIITGYWVPGRVSLIHLKNTQPKPIIVFPCAPFSLCLIIKKKYGKKPNSLNHLLCSDYGRCQLHCCP